MKVVSDSRDSMDGEFKGFDSYLKAGRPSRLAKILKIFAISIGLLAVVGATGSYFYWQSLKKTPQYSLALLIDAARNNDQTAINELVDTNAMVDDFLPQITSKAVELYGRGLSPQILTRVERIAAPVLPAVKERARVELPALIRQKTAKFESVPFAAMVVGADRYLDVATQADTAIVTSKLPEHSFEVKMQRSGTKWKIIGVRDEQLATEIAQKIGQEIIAVATKEGSNGERLGIKDVDELLKQAEDIFR